MAVNLPNGEASFVCELLDANYERQESVLRFANVVSFLSHSNYEWRRSV